MAIDAVVQDVVLNADGSATLHLVARDPKGGLPGQTYMTVIDAPDGIESVVGTHIRGDDQALMVGGVKWAERVGYSRCRLVKRPKKVGAARRA